jgi:cytoskeletal protein CcmA (bactofilin family)
VAFWKKETETKPEIAKKELADKPAPTSSFSDNKVAGTSRSGPQKSEKEQESSDPANERYSKLRSALGAGTVIQGKLSFDTPVRIDGKLSGEVFSSKALIVGETGSIDADVSVASLVVMGHVSGNIKATESIELMKGGSLEGDIESPSLLMEEGARFNGNCSMGGSKKSYNEKTGSQIGSTKDDPSKEPQKDAAQKSEAKSSHSLSGSVQKNITIN